jgi:hypothetical protein
MTPSEIKRLMQQSSALQEALKTDKIRIWQFLRQECIYGYILSCGRCNKVAQLLYSPYALDLCIECVLHDLLVEGPFLFDEYRDPRSRKYNEAYDKNCKAWEDFYTLPDDYDGPPIAIA